VMVNAGIGLISAGTMLVQDG